MKKPRTDLEKPNAKVAFSGVDVNQNVDLSGLVVIKNDLTRFGVQPYHNSQLQFNRMLLGKQLGRWIENYESKEDVDLLDINYTNALFAKCASVFKPEKENEQFDYRSDIADLALKLTGIEKEDFELKIDSVVKAAELNLGIGRG